MVAYAPSIVRAVSVPWVETAGKGESMCSGG